MSLPPLVGELLSIVIRGKFETLLSLSPRWLHDRELIGEAEARESTFELLIPNEAAVFQAGWVRCQVQREVLELQTLQQAEAERLRDLAVGILKTSADTSISLLGINRSVHFSTSNFTQWNAIGDHLVHNEVWDGLLNIPGMRSVTYWCGRTDKYAGRVQIQIEPSLPYPQGIFVAYNDHYDLTMVNSQPTTRKEAQIQARQENTDTTVEKVPVAIEVLTSNWQTSMDLSNAIIERVSEQGRLVT